MNKKRVFIIVLALVLSVGIFSGCKVNVKKEEDGNNNNNSISSEDTTQKEDSKNPEEIPNDKNEDKDAEDNKDQTNENGLDSIIESIYEIKDPGLSLANVPLDLKNMDSVKYNTGLSDASKIKEGLVSEAMIGAQAYSLVIVQLNKAEDAKTVADAMLKGIDTRKWVCVEANDIQVVSKDDIIMLIMVDTELKDSVTSQEIVNAFKEVRGNELDIELKK